MYFLLSLKAAAAAYVCIASHKNPILDDELLSGPPPPLVKCVHNPIRVEFGMIWGCAVFVPLEKREQDAKPRIGTRIFFSLVIDSFVLFRRSDVFSPLSYITAFTFAR